MTVADFGCGTGALFAHLAERAAPPPLGGYVGYDLVPAMVEAARELHADPRARFEVGTAVRRGGRLRARVGRVLDARGTSSDAEWEAHVQGVLQGLWERSRRGLGFNLFTRGAEDFQPAMYAGDPETWATLVLARASGRARRAALRPAAAGLHRPRAPRPLAFRACSPSASTTSCCGSTSPRW